MPFKYFTNEERAIIIKEICNLIYKTMIPIAQICKKSGTTYNSLHRWCAKNSDWKEMLEFAYTERAVRYMEQSLEMIDNIPDFEDSASSSRSVNSAMNKIKHKSDFHMKLAVTLAPDMFGNIGDNNCLVISRLKKEIDELEKLVDERIGIQSKNDTHV